MARGKYGTAKVAFEAALRAAHQARAAHPELLAAVLNDFAVLCKYTGCRADARRMYLRVLRILNSTASPDPNSLATLYHNLAGIAFSNRRYAIASKYARRGIDLRRAARPLDRLALACDEAAFAAILADSGNDAAAHKLLANALRFFRRRLGPRHYEVGAALANLGVLQWKAGRADAAKRTLSSSISILNRALGEGHPRAVAASRNLAMIETKGRPASVPQRRRHRSRS
ncbi:MAG: tetratricopeptide repeat protein [Candidatus Acidiferrales bacterium]